MEYGLIGEKLGHSYSQMIHARLADYRYELKEVAPEALDAFIEKREYRGLNVTIPYKQAVMKHCAELSPEAMEVGSVNTLLVRPDGSLFGHNTDIDGFIYMLRRGGIDPAGAKAVILGSGGTSLTAHAALARLGAREIVTVSRKGPVDYQALYEQHADAEILVNATPVGMYPKNGVSPVSLERLPRVRGVADVIYNPEKTALILEAQAKGIPAVSGLSMLVAQAWEAAERFAGHAIPAGRVEEIVSEIGAQTLNLILVGMPGCGKTTLGQAVATAMHRELVDCDAEIVRRAGKSIPDIFAQDGEDAFRALEGDVLRDVCRGHGLVISTGGGAVLRPENRNAMRQNGRVCLIRRPIEALPRDGRPLSESADAVARLWQVRRAAYEAAADYSVENDETVEVAAERIEEGFYEAAHH